MALPIIAFPSYIQELSREFEPLFEQERQLTQFKRIMTGFVVPEKHTIAHMNGLFTYHTDQSNLNRFVTKSTWEPREMNRVKFSMINSVERSGVVALDDYCVEKYGKKIHGVDWYFDHSKGRSIWGHQIADCVYSGKGIYPLLSSQYLKKGSKWIKSDFKSKIEIQKDHLTELVNLGLNFSVVVMDIWYFCKDLTEHIESLKKVWIAQCKSNRLVKSHNKWISVKDFAQKIYYKVPFKRVILGDEKYDMKVFTVKMKGMGRVRLLISRNKHGNFKFYVTNQLHWNEVAIATRYARRWDIEVWHREGKGTYGLEDC